MVRKKENKKTIKKKKKECYDIDFCEKQEHKFNRNILFVTLLILLILMVAIYSGIVLYDKYKKQQIVDEMSLLNQQIILDDLYNSYLKDINSLEEKCEVLNNQLTSQLKINEKLFENLKNINRNAIVETDNELKFMYVLTNIKLWLHYTEIEKSCVTETKTGLYFYPEYAGYSSEKAKKDAETRVFEKKLSNFLDDCGDFRSISLPYIDYIPILDQIIKDLNITQAPAFYYNGQVYYDVSANPTQEFYDSFECKKN